MVLLRDGGGLVDIRYSASCGGHGEDNDAIWSGAPDPSLRGRSDTASGGMSRITDDNLGAFLDGDGDAWCNRSRLGKSKFRWTETVSEAELTTRVQAEYPEVGRVKQLVPRQRGVSGRIGALAIQGERASVVVSGDLHIRRLLGGLKSTLFEVKRRGDAFVIHGAGFGHGVGMCQMGAIGMAGAGKPYAQILAHYYRGSHLHRLY
jgi:SpoIID/LytB domain protein